jgi:hypothetical protein
MKITKATYWQKFKCIKKVVQLLAPFSIGMFSIFGKDGNLP